MDSSRGSDIGATTFSKGFDSRIVVVSNARDVRFSIEKIGSSWSNDEDIDCFIISTLNYSYLIVL